MNGPLEPQNGSSQDRALELAVLKLALERMDDPAVSPSAELPAESAFDFRRYLDVLLRRKWVILAAIVIALVAALVFTFNTTPLYRSSLLLQIEPQSDRILEFQGSGSLGEPAWDWQYYQTQYELLKSQTLARRVIDQLGLEAAAKVDRAESADSFLGGLKASIRGLIRGEDRSEDEPAGKDSKAKPNLEGALLGNLTVSPLRDSRLVRIHYDSPSASEAAAVANAIAENFINMSLERRYDATAYAKQFLEERIEQVRANLEDSEKRLIDYAREREIVDLEDKLGNLMQTLNAMSQTLVGVEAERIQAEARYARSLEGKRPAAMEIQASETVQSLKARKGELELEYQEQLKVFKPGYPKMQQLQRQIAEIDQMIAEEIAFIGEAAESDYEAKLKEQTSLQARVNEIKTELLDLQNRSTDYQTLKREVETNRELYDGLLQRMKEVGVVAGITTNNISIVDRAKVPGAAYKPNLRNNLTIAVVIGLLVGIGLAFLFEHVDDTIKNSEDLERRAGVPVLGVLPMSSAKAHKIDKRQIPLLSAKDPKSPLAEAVRSLRTSLVCWTAEGAPKIMHVTSSAPGEGKTTVATSVAIAFAQAGGKVLIIDADMRAPSLHGVFSRPNSLGLSSYLAGDADPAEIAQPTQVTRLFTITSGPIPPNPVELLSSAKMIDLLSLAAERFDYVIVDGPPIIGLADALVLSTISHGTMVVVDAGRTRFGALEGSMKRLRGANATILGAVLDRFGRGGRGYGYGYSYDYHYSYHYGPRERVGTLPEKV